MKHSKRAARIVKSRLERIESLGYEELLGDEVSQPALESLTSVGKLVSSNIENNINDWLDNKFIFVGDPLQKQIQYFEEKRARVFSTPTREDSFKCLEIDSLSSCSTDFDTPKRRLTTLSLSSNSESNLLARRRLHLGSIPQLSIGRHSEGDALQA